MLFWDDPIFSQFLSIDEYPHGLIILSSKNEKLYIQPLFLIFFTKLKKTFLDFVKHFNQQQTHKQKSNIHSGQVANFFKNYGFIRAMHYSLPSSLAILLFLSKLQCFLTFSSLGFPIAENELEEWGWDRLRGEGENGQVKNPPPLFGLYLAPKGKTTVSSRIKNSP